MRSPLIAILAVALLAAGAAQAQAPAPKFLEPGDLDPALILPPPPADGSPAAAAELAELQRIAAAHTPERLAQAKHDDEVEDVRSIGETLGPAFDLERYPATKKLFADLRAEDSAAAKRAKAYFQRERPFFHEKALDVCDDGSDRRNSYPSGHATMGWAAAVMLADLIPGNAQVILARAGDYAESRLYCGVHYRSDIVAGQVLGTALVGRLMQKPAFRSEVDAARAELTAAHLAP